MVILLLFLIIIITFITPINKLLSKNGKSERKKEEENE